MIRASIIIPIQVSSKEFDIYLEHLDFCLYAATQQTIKNEIIVVDYISDSHYVDSISATAKKYNCELLRVEYPDKIWCRGRALNAGIKNAHEGYILFVDADCILPPDYVELHLQKITRNRFTFSKFYNTTKNIKKSGSYMQLLSQKECLLPPLSDCTSHQGFHKLTLEKHGIFDPVYRGWGAEDNDLYLHMKRSGISPVEISSMPIHLYHPTWQELMKNAGRDEEQRTTLEQNRARFINYKRTGKK